MSNKKRDDDEHQHTALPVDSPPEYSDQENTPGDFNLTYRSQDESEDLENGMTPQIMGGSMLEIDADNKLADDANVFIRYLYTADALDKHYSKQIMEINAKWAVALLCVWAHLFNRKQILITLSLVWVIGSQTYNTWLPNLGYNAIERDVTAVEQFRLGAVAFFIYGFGLLVLVAFAQTFKYTIRRPRPNAIPNSLRWGKDLRGHEDGTFSMPSGDSAAAADFCLFISTAFCIQSIWVITPLVCLGRVFYFCHWLGDTFMGVLLGLFSQQVIFVFLSSLIPFFRAVAGQSDVFTPAPIL